MTQLFHEKLRYLRQRQGWTQAQLAEHLGFVRQAHIANLEAGRDVPSLELLIRMASLFNVTTDYLLRDTIPPDLVSMREADVSEQRAAQTMSFGEKLRTLRRHHNLTQVALIQYLGLSGQGYISNLEGGRKLPSLELVVQIADLFGVTTDDLLRESGELPASSA